MVPGCQKRYTDPSSLRKHVKNHTPEEQQMYRRFKDQINAQKQQLQQQQQHSMDESSQPWEEPEGGTAAALAAAAATAADPSPAQQQPPPSASTLLAVGLQAGGTMMVVDSNTIDDGVGGCAAGPAAADDVLRDGRGNGGGGNGSGGLRAQAAKKGRLSNWLNRKHFLEYDVLILSGGAGLPFLLPHQPNSLDDLEPSDTLPFDDVPVRYDEEGGGAGSHGEGFLL